MLQSFQSKRTAAYFMVMGHSSDNNLIPHLVHMITVLLKNGVETTMVLFKHRLTTTKASTSEQNQGMTASYVSTAIKRGGTGFWQSIVVTQDRRYWVLAVNPRHTRWEVLGSENQPL